MMKVKPTMNLANGIVSVPGPRGAGDIQPAMLSPGESVIPAKQSAKYMPLIQSMVADKVPGYENSNVNPFSGTKAPAGMVYTPSGLLIPAGGGQASAASRSPDRVERGIDRILDNAKVKKLADRFDKLSAQMGKTTPTIAKLENTVNKTTQAFGTDKTRGFRGFIGGYGNVNNTVKDEGGATRAATAAERTNMRQMNRMNFTQKMMPAQMIGMMAPMIAQGYAQKNPDSAIAKNMDMIMMLSMLTMLLPMLNSPLKLLIATAVGLVAVFKMQAATIKKNIIEGQQQASSMTMTTKQLEELGKITKQVSVTQTAAAKRAGRNTDIVPVSMEFGNNLIANSDFGKNLKSSFENSLATFGSGTAVDSLVNQLGTAVSQGVLDRGQAESIAVALTRNLKDARLELDVRGRLIQLLGPNGENLVNSPLQVQVDLITTGQNLQKAALNNLNLVASQQRGINTKGEIGQLVGGGVGGALLGARAAVQVSDLAAGAGIERAAGAGRVGSVLRAAKAARVAGTAGSAAVGATGAGAPIGAAGIAISTVIFGGIELAIRQYQKGKEKAAIGKAAGMLEGIISQNVAASQASIDALTSQYDSAIVNLQLKKQTLKTEQERKAVDDQIAGLQTKKESGLKTLRLKQAEILGSASSNYDKVSKRSLGETLSPFGSGRGQVRDKYMEAFSVGMQDKFKENPALKAKASALQSQLDQMKSDKVTLEISTLVTSDVLTPNEASTLVSTLTNAGGDIQKNLQALVTVQGTEGVQRLSTILTLLPNESNQKQLVLAVKNMNKSDADATFSAIEELGKIPDYIGIDINIETQKNDIADLKARGKEIDALRKKFPNGQLNLKALVKMQEEAGGPGKNLTLDAAITQWEAISKLPKELQFQAMISIGSVTESDSFEKIMDRELTTMFAKKYPKARGRLAAEALNKFKKDADNISAAEKAYWEKVAPQLFGAATPDTSKGGGTSGLGGDGPKKDMSFLNDLGQRLKLFKESSFNALDPLNALKKFFDPESGATRNDYLQKQQGALKEIEAAATKAGITLDKDFMDIIRGMDAEQFALWSKTLFDIGKKGNIKGLTDQFELINKGFKAGTISTFIDNLRQENKAIDDQVKAYDILIDQGFSNISIQKILADATIAARIASEGSMKNYTQENKELEEQLQKIIGLNQKLAQQKLGGNINDLKKQSEAYKILSAAGVKQEVIIEILKDKSNAWAIANSPGNVADQYGPLIAQTKNYLDFLKLIEDQTKTFEQTTQEAIDANVSALDLQARTLQNKFDRDNFKLKADIVLAEDAVKNVNDNIQKEQDRIDKINLELKYDPRIGQNFLDDLQEKINDAQRSMDINFDRPLQVLSDRSAVLSNDLTLIDKATEAINEKYDAQEKALQTISQLNSDIAAQEKSRISLADALSQGDISAAAQLANDMRTTAAEAANRKSGEFIAASRKAETDNVVSAGGMTKAQIEAEQFKISQQSYALEQQRKTVQTQILALEDQVYNITELREAKLLSIRDIETIIDGLRANQLATAQADLDGLQSRLDIEQKILDGALLKIEEQKLKWDEVQLKLDAYKLALTNSKLELESMLDLIKKIALAMATIPTTTATKSSAFVPTASDGGGETPEQKAARLKAEADAAAQAAADAAAKAAADAAAAKAAVLSGYATAKAAGDMNAAALFAAKVNPSALAAQESGAIGAASIAAQLKAAERALVASNAVMKQASTLASFKAKEAADLAASNIKGRVGRMNGGIIPKYMSYGGMVPKYFAVGGMSRGTDTIPAMLTPGEFVMTKYAVDSYGVDKMKAINSGSYDGEKVYNYNLNVNVKSDANPEDIARVVMTQIRQVDSQRIRAQRG
jgi:hypothetical protein